MSLRARSAVCVVFLVAACGLGLAQLSAQAPSWRQRLAPAEINLLVNANRLRITDLQVAAVTAGGPLFDVALVGNDEGRAWAWSWDLTAARMQAMMKAAPRRPAALVPYELAPGDTRLAVVWTPGAPTDTAVDWAVLADVTPDGLAALQAGIDRFASIARGRNRTLVIEQVIPYFTAAGERRVVIGRWGGLAPAALGAWAAATAFDRPLGHTITHRVSALLAATDGTQGLYLRQLGGGVLANQNENFVFEPASTIKAGPGLHAFQQVEAGTWDLTDPVNVFQPPASGSCPGNMDVGDETLQNAIQEMLWHSDNSRTRVIVDTFGQGNVNATMAAAGMASSSINHIIGCGGPIANTLTLVDAGELYEGTADGTLIDAANVDLFHSFFAGRGQFMVEGYDWTGLWDTDIPNMIVAEAPAGMTASQRQAYRNQMDLAYKAGNYKICVNASCSDYRDHISIAGWASIPFCTGTVMQNREFVFGLFIYNSTSDATSSAAFSSAKGELLREQIRDGMASCFHADLSLTSAAAPSPVLSGSIFTAVLNAGNAGPMEAASVAAGGNTPAGTTFASSVAAAGWSTSAPPVGGTGAVSFSRAVMAVGSTPQFSVGLRVNCQVPNATAIMFGSSIASASTPDLNPGNNTSSAQVQVSNPPPVIGPATASPAELWPPNHKMKDITVNYTVADNCGTPVCSLSAVSSEPDNGLGDGDTSGDIEIVDDHHLRLRAERAGPGPGRVYTITVACTDSGGGQSSTQTMVMVPHNK